MVHHNVCPLCSSEKIFLHFRCIDHLISKKEFAIYKCPACGFEFTQDYPEEDEIGQYYESTDYISHSDTSKGLSNKIYRLVRSAMLLKKRGIINKVTGLHKGSLLDIGSGTGHFAGTMKKAGWQVKGIEINEKARDFSISRFGLEIIGPGQISTLEADSFDCITLWHVLEHFHDPFKYASDIFRLLKPGGMCVIALPNCSSYDAKHYGRFWAAYDVPRHLWHFNPSTFRLFSEKTGFIFENLRTLPFDVFYISLLSERYKGSGLSFITGIAKAKLFAFLSVLKRRRSSSVIYILRKPIG
ncbi:MAG: methyltransferase domain-containing protein [Bacteroidales bacterium]|nr:methyltransferase domain-containing protein [Bacteroidales bacterium]